MIMNHPSYSLSSVSWRHLFHALSVLKDEVRYNLHTLVLFTYTDYKTIFFPISIFAAVAAPLHSPVHLLRGLVWIWFHLLQCNVSNQYKSASEDAINRPWRPLPAGRMSLAQATVLRWVLFVFCATISVPYGWDVAAISLSLTMVMVLYDELQLAGHWLGKNAMNIGGYVTFELGATKIMGQRSALDQTATMSVVLSAMVIFTTIQMQDFPDVLGDAALGRDTIPIRFPKASRVFTALALPTWTVLLVQVWRLGAVSTMLFAALALWISWRNYNLRDAISDSRTYVIFNLWLFLAHLLPINMRKGLLVW